MRRRRLVISSSLLFTIILSSSSFALAQGPQGPNQQPAQPPAASPAKKQDVPAAKSGEEPTSKDEMPEQRNAFNVAGTPLLPIGDLSNGFTFGIGGTLGYDRVVHPHVQIIGRTGYSHLFPKSGLNVSLGAVPIWGGARYTFGINEGGYFEGALGPTVLFASASVNVLGDTRSVSDSEVKIGTAIGGGYKFGKLDVGGRLAFWDLGRPGDSATIFATIGYSFATF
jgi:hypothetical protein